MRDVAHGIRWTGVSPHQALRDDDANADWPRMHVTVDPGPAPPAAAVVDGQRVRHELADGRHVLVMDRATSRATLHGSALDDDSLVHPYLGPIAAIASRWRGRESFHAGLVAGAQGAWMVLGDKEAGKSTLLAALHRAGHLVLSDDLVMVDGRDALAGPRTLDLREPPAGPLAGLSGRAVREGQRWRIALPDAPSRWALSGWLRLGWGAQRTVSLLPASQRLRALAAWRGAGMLDSDPRVLLELASLPGYVLERPRGWQLDADVAEVARLTAGGATPSA